MLIPCLFVGVGGFLGAVLRYLLGLIPCEGSFPLMTMLINFSGAFAIGVITALSGNGTLANLNITLFLKTGICGGFTTFSTFSLETMTLLQQGKTLMGMTYAVASVVLCLVGVLLGTVLGKIVCLA
jgi:CrcB protein